MASASHIPGVTDLLSALGLGVAQTDSSETADVHKSLDAARATIKTAALSSRAPSIESHVSTKLVRFNTDCHTIHMYFNSGRG